MEAKEALKMVLESLPDDDGYRIYGGLKQVVLDALNKQIPQRVILNPPYASICPVCNKTLYVQGEQYCWNCGKKLDWEN